MPTTNSRTLGFTLLILAVLFGLFFLPSGQAFFEDLTDGFSGKRVSCDFEIEDLPGLDPRIKNQVCSSGGGCFKFGRLGFFESSGEVALYVDGLKASDKHVSFSTLGTDEQVNLNACVRKDSNGGTLQLRNDGGGLLDSKEVTW